MALTISFNRVALILAAATNALVQSRLLAHGGRWLPSTIKSGLGGFAVTIGVLASYFGLGGIVVRLWG
ncbi:hypothetical protein NS277_07900 [Novosphingobium barchaimii]|nr:hypothetical protein NS277_07900 [Novosphingobium barchaimii]